VAMQLSTGDATTVAAALVQADMRGIHSHGVTLATHYLERLAAGSIRPAAKMVVEQLGTCVARLEGDCGMGQVVMNAAADAALRMAQQHGAGLVAVRNSNHCGALPYYGLKIAASGCVGVVLTHTDPIMLPFGAKDAFLGTNPLCITMPGADGHTFCLDMSTSIVAWNRVLDARRNKQELGEGWAVDAKGLDTRDAASARALHPAGAHKGSGLAVMIDLVCAVLSGMLFGADLPHMFAVTETRRLGGFVGALRFDSFGPPAVLEDRVREYARRLHSLTPRAPDDTVKFPGEIEAICHQRSASEGVRLPPATLTALSHLARQHHISWPFSPDGNPSQ
ncbi:MAG: Ldh family oxidoreductase, partial [Limisphaerales bacterium]